MKKENFTVYSDAGRWYFLTTSVQHVGIPFSVLSFLLFGFLCGLHHLIRQVPETAVS